MLLIFSRNKDPHNHSAKNLRGRTGAEVLIDNSEPYSAKHAPSYSSNSNISNTNNLAIKIPSEIYTQEEFEEVNIVETTALKQASESIHSLSENMTLNNYLTVSGTIKRGKKKGQSVEVVLNMSREELEILEVDRAFKHCCHCNIRNGMGFHILLWTAFCFPFSVITSGVYSFCMGTITWYNVFKLFSENQMVWCRIFIPPLLLVLYPFLIILISLGLGFYSGFKQLSCCWDSWKKEFADYEKGFFGWLCNSLDISECSPYEVVILSSVQKCP